MATVFKVIFGYVSGQIITSLLVMIFAYIVLTVLLGLLVGMLLAGIPGSLAALPVIASYAAIERIWLKPFLRDGVSEMHELQQDEAFGEKD